MTSTKSSSMQFGNLSRKTKFKVSNKSAFVPWKPESNKTEIYSFIEANFHITFVNGNLKVSSLPEVVDEN